MTKRSEIYKCLVCGNIVEVLHTGVGQLVCCGQPMQLQKENSVDAAQEKHVPIVKIDSDTISVNVGEIDHPMEEAHYIEWVELVCKSNVCRVELKPGDKPHATFKKCCEDFTIRAYCNLHGLWKNK